jgi:hypothetical protein
MPTVASLPAASSVVSNDEVPISQVNNDGSITLRRATPAQIASGSGSVLATGAAMSGFLQLTNTDTAVGTGTGQSSGTLINKQYVVTQSAPAGTAFVLPTAAQVNLLAPISFKNADPVNNATVYPPVGGQINNLGVNQPRVVGSGNTVVFIPGSTTGQWWV